MLVILGDTFHFTYIYIYIYISLENFVTFVPREL